MTLEEAKAQYADLSREIADYDDDIATLEEMVVDLEDLTNKYADLAKEASRYKWSMHDKLIKSVGSIIGLKEFFVKKRATAERQLKKREFGIRCLEAEARHKAERKGV